jgi:hypothetical protein
MDIALKALMALDESWPFREPVDAEDVPDYYDVIKVRSRAHVMGSWLSGLNLNPICAPLGTAWLPDAVPVYVQINRLNAHTSSRG